MEERKHNVDELIELMAELDTSDLGIPHPLSNFALSSFVDGFHAEIITTLIHDTVLSEPDPDSGAWKGATWFLLESQQAYFFACAEAGIDALRLRNHLRECLERDGY